jgi:hypothetical protein
MVLTTEKTNRLKLVMREINRVEYLLLEKNTYVFTRQDKEQGLRVNKDCPVEGFMFTKFRESLEAYLTHLKSLLKTFPADKSHDWIEATLTNLKAHGLYDPEDIDAHRDTSGYVFLINGRSVIYDEDFYLSFECYGDEANRPETCSLTVIDSSHLIVTHFAKVCK